MRQILSTVITLLWALWFGGVLMLFIAVSSLFVTFHDRHDLAGQAAARIFRVFNAYQLALAAGSLIATFIWYVLGPPRLKMGLFTLFGLATFAACVITLYIAPKIEMLQREAETHSTQFARLHGTSMMAYLAEALLLLIAGILLSRMHRSEGATR
jgi:glucan phosphoethanolaminetransferase (alkaline phosphatase superfamily)